MDAEQPKPEFSIVTIECPNLWMTFKATQPRIQRVVDFVLKEAAEADAEYKQNLKPETTATDK